MAFMIHFLHSLLVISTKHCMNGISLEEQHLLFFYFWFGLCVLPGALYYFIILKKPQITFRKHKPCQLNTQKNFNTLTFHFVHHYHFFILFNQTGFAAKM